MLRSEAEPANAPLGSDGAGTVAAMGNGVERINPGDRVYAFGLVNPKGGFYAEYAAIKADDVSPIPGKLVLQTASARASERHLEQKKSFAAKGSIIAIPGRLTGLKVNKGSFRRKGE